MEKILRRIKDNDLYIKLEKCMWKVRKIGFLRVIMESNRIRIEKVKVKKVLKWPTSSCIKNIQKFLGLANYYRRFMKDFAGTISVRVANSKLELSQLLFISIRQRELVKSLRYIDLFTYTDSTWSVH